MLKENNCEVIISSGTTEEEYINEIKDCDALFVRNEKITPKIMDAAPKLKVIAKHGIGYDNIDINYATKKGIQVVYAPLGNINSVAEHAMLLIMTCARRYGFVEREFKSGNYNIRYTLEDAHDVNGKTLGLIGCGNIGQELAKKAIYGFNMKVIGYDPYVNEEKLDIPIEIVESKEDLLKKSDFISLHMPSTKETKGSFGLEEFKMMKKSAYIINTSRGDIIKEKDMIQALKEGIISGAGLDVYEKEPISIDNSLLSMDNVIATPHCAGMTAEASERLSYGGAQGILEVLLNKKLTWPVNKLNI